MLTPGPWHRTIRSADHGARRRQRLGSVGFLELNPANSVSVLTLDVDSAERILDLLSRGVQFAHFPDRTGRSLTRAPATATQAGV